MLGHDRSLVVPVYLNPCLEGRAGRHLAPLEWGNVGEAVR